MARTFDKPAITHAQQVALLQERGMSIDDVAEAEFYLKQLNYYRLSAYWLPFQLNHATHQFKPGTSFKDVLNLYSFDRELRLLVFDSIERIEVSVRSHWAHQLGHLHGPHAHLNDHLFDAEYYQRNFKELSKEVKRSKETFILHFQGTYSEPLPPVWAVCEVMSLGLLSKWYASLKPMEIRQAISKNYGLDESILKSWLQHLSHVRNICAHHSRLWNREFTLTPKLPKSKPERLVDQLAPSSRRLYNTLVILLYYMDLISPNHSFRSCLKNLVAKPIVQVKAMGFPENWSQRAIWCE